MPQKVFTSGDKVLHVYLARKLQNLERNLILMKPFLGQTKTVQKGAARWAGLAVLLI